MRQLYSVGLRKDNKPSSVQYKVHPGTHQVVVLEDLLLHDVVVGVTDADRALDFVGVAVADDIDADRAFDFFRVAVDADRAFDFFGVAVADDINADKRVSSSTST
jgi:hypothetical protein